MIERRRKPLRAAAVAHVHADHVHAALPGFAAGADHVFRFAGTFEPMHDDDGERVLLFLVFSVSGGLPMAVAQDLRAFLRMNLEDALFCLRQCAQPRQEISRKGLRVSVAESTTRDELRRSLRQSCLLFQTWSPSLKVWSKM